MAKAKKAPIDLRSMNLSIEGESSAFAGLAKIREHLESVVETFSSTKYTGCVIRLKGKRRYITDPVSGEKYVYASALQFLYNIEDAVESGDTERLIRMVYGFADARQEVYNLETYGVVSVTALVDKQRNSESQKERGRKSAILKSGDDRELLVKIAYRNNRDRPDSHKAIAQELFDRHGITGRTNKSTNHKKPMSTKTVSRLLKQLGLSDNANVVRGQR